MRFLWKRLKAVTNLFEDGTLKWKYLSRLSYLYQCSRKVFGFAANYYLGSQWGCSPVLTRLCWKFERQLLIFDDCIKIEIACQIKLPLTVQQEGFGILSIASFAASYYWGSQWGCSPVLMRFCCYSGIYCSRGSVFLGSHGLFFLSHLAEAEHCAAHWT